MNAIGLLVLFLGMQAQAAKADENAVYTTLSQRRPVITLPAYTQDQKQLVAEQAQTILRDVYVNRDVKIAAYGPQIDPVPLIARIAADARILSDATLHSRIGSVFASQHDLHLSYLYPVPHACYRSLLPFGLDQAIGTTGELVIAVSAITKISEILAVVPEARVISVGDTLLTYDGVEPAVAIKKLAALSRGANEFGSIRRAVENLVFRSHRSNDLPENDVVRLTFRNRTGQEYAVEIPWVSKADTKCLQTADTESIEAKILKDQAVDEYQIEFEKLYKPHQRSSEMEPLTDTREPTIHYDVLQNEFGKMAYLRLDSFAPEDLSTTESIILIKGLLEQEFAGTDGLIIDLRDNGGGWISYGESLVQLFTPKNIQAQGFRLQNTKVIRDLFAAIPGWSQPYRDALNVATTIGARYTEAMPLTPVAQVNDLGQSYFKPVAVLTNSACYSTCDMMTALMQDFSIATIWGADGRTGAGGANNVQLNYFTDNLPVGHNLPFFKLPGKQSMGVSWRQTVRVNKNAGVLLDEAGVAADRLATPAIADFFTDSLFQLRTISADLSRNSSAMQSWYKQHTDERIDLLVNTAPELAMKVSDTEAVEFRLAGKSIGFEGTQAPASTTGTALVLRPKLEAIVGTKGSLELLGYRAGQRVWRAMQDFRFVPEATVLQDADQIALDFSVPSIAPVVVYTSGAAVNEGWSVQNGKLKAGLGESYPDNIDTEASLFVDLTSRTSPIVLAFDVEGKTEKDYDFFSVKICSAEGETDFFSVSGDIAQQTVTHNLSNYVGEKIEIRFRFFSDSNVSERGVSIANLKVGSATP